MRILLAEDERELSDALSAILKHNNYSVDAVYNGSDATDYLCTDLYDCAILDIMMPGIDGFEVLKIIRERGISVPVLVLTAKSGIDDKVKGLDLGADDYLTKPFSTKELLARVRAMTRRKSEFTENVLSFGDIKLDRSACELTGPTDCVRLGSKEFQMLEMLMVTPGNVIPTEKFMDKIWGYESETELNIVWVYASYLRRRLSSVGSSVQIKAKRNLGYVLEEPLW